MSNEIKKVIEPDINKGRTVSPLVVPNPSSQPQQTPSQPPPPAPKKP